LVEVGRRRGMTVLVDGGPLFQGRCRVRWIGTVALARVGGVGRNVWRAEDCGKLGVGVEHSCPLVCNVDRRDYG
jgi:hypothetical protein